MKFLILLIITTIGLAQVKIKTGIEVLKSNDFEILTNKRIGLVTNQTGVDNNLVSTVDLLNNAPNVKLVALFGPEHGVRGDVPAGEYVESYIDKKTGLKVYSLYGKNKKPSKDMLKDLDALVYDIQDIGARSYTYISTMGLCMEAAAENGIEFIVLDRPNPLGGRIEGYTVDDGFYSFVSQYPIPYIYGLTCGELADYINDKGLLNNKTKCKLNVVAMEGWNRDMIFQETGLEWIPTSPHIPEITSSFYYSATGIIGELYVFNIGVGYTLPFKLITADWIDSGKLAEALNGLMLDGVIFRPTSIKPYYSVSEKKYVNGVQIHITDYKKVRLLDIQFLVLQEIYKLHPEKNPFELCEVSRIAMFDKVTGTDKVRKLLEQYKFNYSEIKKIFEKSNFKYKSEVTKYYIYN